MHDTCLGNILEVMATVFVFVFLHIANTWRKFLWDDRVNNVAETFGYSVKSTKEINGNDNWTNETTSLRLVFFR